MNLVLGSNFLHSPSILNDAEHRKVKKFSETDKLRHQKIPTIVVKVRE